MTTDEIDQYRAFLHGLNVGIELMASGLNESLTEDEYLDWVREQYGERVPESEDHDPK